MAEVMTQGERNFLPELIEALKMVPADQQQFMLGYATAVATVGTHPDKKEEN